MLIDEGLNFPTTDFQEGGRYPVVGDFPLWVISRGRKIKRVRIAIGEMNSCDDEFGNVSCCENSGHIGEVRAEGLAMK